MNRVTINGVSYSGGHIVIQNNTVKIDGKDVTPDQKQITISVQGNVDVLSVDVCDSVTVTGEVGTIKTMSGDVNANDVKGDVSTMSGDVHARTIAGKVSTMSGDIIR